jgi:hypothetical protein
MGEMVVITLRSRNRQEDRFRSWRERVSYPHSKNQPEVQTRPPPASPCSPYAHLFVSPEKRCFLSLRERLGGCEMRRSRQILGCGAVARAVSDAALLLASDEAQYLTGAALPIDAEAVAKF